MTAGIVGSFATKLVTSGLARVGDMTLQKYFRLRKVDAAIRNVTAQDPDIQSAMSDFEIVIGTHYGEFTQPLEAFFRELERTGLITALAEQGLLRTENKGLQKAFIELHRSFFPTENGNAEELFRRMTVAFGASLDALMKDRNLASLLRLTTKDTHARLKEVDSKLDVLLQGKRRLDANEMDTSFLRICKGLTPLFKEIRIETNRGPRKIDIAKIYIPSKLRQRRGKKVPAEVAVSARRHAPDSTSRELQSYSYQDFKTGFRRAVVLGDPGGGKSTLCQFLCCDFAKQCTFQLSHPEDQNYAPTTEKIPLRVVLRSFERARLTEPQLTLFDFIVRDLRNVVSGDDDNLKDAVYHALAFGRAVLAFDGLDEILDASRRREFVDDVTAFCDQFPLCPVLVTSRIVGYEAAPLPADFEELVLDKFDDGEINAYLIKFLRVVNAVSKEEAEVGATSFIEQTERNARDLRQNPLLLGLMAFLFAAKGDVPSNRPEIYRECAILMFEKWDQNRGIRAHIPVGFDLLHLFSMIAAKIYGNADLEEGVDRKWLEQRTFEYFIESFENRAKALDAAQRVTEFLTGRSWVMSEFGTDVYRFTHRTFLEYFFARYLDEEFETVAELWNAIRPKVAANQWNVIAHLALQLKTYRNVKRTGFAIDEIQRALPSLGSSTGSSPFVRFIAQSLEYLPGPEQRIKQLVSDIVAKALEIPFNDRASAVSAIGESCACCLERREFARITIANTLVRIITQGEPGAELALALVAISGPANAPWYFTPKPVTVLPPDVVRRVLDGLKQFAWQRALTDPKWAYTYWTAFEEKFEELFAIHHFEMFASNLGVPLLQTYIDPLIVLPYRAYDPHSLPSENRADLEALRVIGNRTYTDEQLFPRTAWSSIVDTRFPDDLWISILDRFKKDELLFRGVVLCLFVLMHRRLEENSPHKSVSRRNGARMSGETRDRIRAMFGTISARRRGALEFFHKWLESPARDVKRRS
jgi:hypothetical protein